jgi:ATP-binding protein involved in chromosome partitioning
MAADFGAEVIGSLPLDIRIREQADSGRPTVVAEPDSDIALAYKAIARKVAVSIAAKAKDLSLKMPAIKVQNT